MTPLLHDAEWAMAALPVLVKQGEEVTAGWLGQAFSLGAKQSRGCDGLQHASQACHGQYELRVLLRVLHK